MATPVQTSNANPWPLQNKGPQQFQDKSPSATTNEVDRYREMLGFQAAGEDVGLFYQLNRNASERDQAGTPGATSAGTGPIEANSRYA